MSKVTSERVDVTCVIASYNTLRYLESAVESALAQQGVSVEVIIVDDGSKDGSYELAKQLAARDLRVRCFQTPTNQGPSGARNLALDNARGEWISILDSDDLVHPGRAASLIALAEEKQADLVSDDMLVFQEDDGQLVSVERFLPLEGSQNSFELSLVDYLRPSSLFRRSPEFGYLKPLFRASSLADLRYNPNLRIAEDDDLIVRLLLQGAKYWVSKRALYFYRKHNASISHRLSLENLELMIASNRALAPRLESHGLPCSAFWDGRWKQWMRFRAFTKWVLAVKGKDYLEALRLLFQFPSLALWFHAPIWAAIKRAFNLGVHLPAKSVPETVDLPLRQRLETFADYSA